MRIAQPNYTKQTQSNESAYFIIHRDRSDPNPLAMFFMAYSKQNGRVLWESATYYNESELRRVAHGIIATLAERLSKEITAPKKGL